VAVWPYAKVLTPGKTRRARVTYCPLSEAEVRTEGGTYVANPEHLQILEQGGEAWNAWRDQNRSIRPDLSGADLHWANLSRANLRRTDLSEANLSEANLGSADLTGANLSHATLFETVFGDTNLTAVQGLETCVHRGPSILNHRTLARSRPLPLAFLRAVA
jgi:hypothetical protein